ncbi:MAG: hypothetical protein M3R67_03560 [Acidobacteriota bacterium]|nr:hypothetical protein [Acidobacteriota bacterium]
MKRSFSVFLCAIVLLAPARLALGWGNDGHETVGKIASLRIKPRTTQKIAQILQPGETLANISTWAHTVKDRQTNKRYTTSGRGVLRHSATVPRIGRIVTGEPAERVFFG